MISYHVSKEDYSPGAIVSTNKYFEITVARGNEWVEDVLERHRPEGAPSRSTCVFTFPELQLALAYGSRLPQPVYYYVVEIPDKHHKCPMVLCEAIRSRGRYDGITQQLCKEYWTPTLEWQVYELLTSSFKVIEKLQLTDFSERSMGIARYMGDATRSSEWIKTLSRIR
ncbi:MAG: hypothetical protein JNJ75_03645 [Cyclobacteriaceae bacterium]|nr:hypothetical protein [Cyclobacteriaceae bacterium]